MTPVESEVDVVVVGAGVAGLTAAERIESAGRSVRVFEARARLGGRLLSHPIDTQRPHLRLDLGATWFWANEPRVLALVDRLGIATHAQHIHGDAVYQDPRVVQRLEGNPIAGPAGRISGGMDQLAEALGALLSDGTVRLGSPVKRIASDSSGISVEVEGESRPDGEPGRGGSSTRAQSVVLAIPPALAVTTIAFSPDIPPDTRTIAERTPVWMGAMTKIVALYSHAFWRDQGLAGTAVSHRGPMREVHDMSGVDGSPAALFGFVPPTMIGSPVVSEAEVLSQLVALFGGQAATPEALIIHDWRSEAFTSPPGVEALQSYELFGHPVFSTAELGGRLHWASTETAPAFAGHIEGALLAGERAAAAALDGLPAS